MQLEEWNSRLPMHAMPGDGGDDSPVPPEEEEEDDDDAHDMPGPDDDETKTP